MRKKVFIATRLEPELHRRMLRASKRSGMSLYEFISKAVESLVTKYEKVVLE